MTQIEKLIHNWKEEAEVVRTRYRDETLASLCETHARELEMALRQSDEEAVSLRRAAEISGYSYSHIRRLMDGGTLTNVGEPGNPKVLVGELPIKPGRGAGSHARRAAEKSLVEKVFRDPGNGFRVL